MTRMRKFLRATGGTTAIEFGFTAPMFMGLVFGIVEAGLALWTQFGLENAVETAARCAAVNRTTCSTSSTVANYAASNALGVTIPVANFSYSKPSCGHQVAGTYTYSFLTHYFNAASVTLRAQSCFPDINAGG